MLGVSDGVGIEPRTQDFELPTRSSLPGPLTLLYKLDVLGFQKLSPICLKGKGLVYQDVIISYTQIQD